MTEEVLELPTTFGVGPWLEGGAAWGNPTVADPGDWLVDQRGLLERGEATWLEVLADFDRNMGWAADGQLSCVQWLVWRTGMSRGTAFEKVRVAHQLRRRPALAEAFAGGRLSYSAVRAITRLDHPDPPVDAALIDLAIVGTVRDLERAVRHYQLCAEQELPPDVRRLERRGMQLRRGWDGLGTAEVTLDEAELEELDVALRAFMDARFPGRDVEDGTGDPVDEFSRDDDRGPVELVPIWRRRVEAFMDLVRVAMAHLGTSQAGGDDRYLVHIVAGADGQGVEHLDGTPVHPATAARIVCDTSIDLGRRTRTWSRAQRRVIAVRDAGRCRFPGCEHRLCDVHHLHPWAASGPTDVANGLLLCARHHTLVHEGFRAVGEANGTVIFARPDGSVLGSSAPPARCHGMVAA